jgi:FAD/FMN-containing dehydrogenase
MWAPDEPRAAEFRAWLRDAGMRSRAHGTGRSYLNFQTHDEPHGSTRASYGTNYERLAAVKRKYDPDNLFRSKRNLLSAAESS